MNPNHLLVLLNLLITPNDATLEDHVFDDKTCVVYIVDASTEFDQLRFYENLAIRLVTNISLIDKGCKPRGYFVASENVRYLNRLIDDDLLLPHTTLGILAKFFKKLAAKAQSKAIHLFAIEDQRTIGQRSGATVKFRVGAFHCPPFMYYNETQRLLYNGIEKYMLDEITRGWQVEVKGYKRFAWTEVVRDLMDRKIDLSACGQWYNYVSSKRVHLTSPYTQTCATFLVPKPKYARITNIVTKPFGKKVWIAIACTTATITTFLYIFEKRDFSYNLLNAFKVLTDQSIAIFPNNFVIKIILTVWRCLGLLLTLSYSAGIVSNLSAPQLSKAINTFKDLSESGVRWASTDDSAYELIKDTPNKDLRRIIRTRIKSFDVEEKNLAFVTSTFDGLVTETDGFPLKVKKRLKTLKQCFGHFYLTIPLPKNSPHASMFDAKIAKFIEHGFIKAWYSKTLLHFNLSKEMHGYFSDKPAEAEDEAVVRNLLSAFNFLLIGYATATLIFVFEMAISQ